MKGKGVEMLTPARAKIAEMVRRYGVLGLECSILEVQKLAWVLTRVLAKLDITDPLQLEFQADHYGPYAPKFGHLLNALDGSYLHCEKRIADASPLDTMYFDPRRQMQLSNYLKSAEAAPSTGVIKAADELIDGFQSPLGMEALATVDWLLSSRCVATELGAVRTALGEWPSGPDASKRKAQVFTDKLLQAAIDRLGWFTPKTAWRAYLTILRTNED